MLKLRNLSICSPIFPHATVLHWSLPEELLLLDPRTVWVTLTEPVSLLRQELYLRTQCSLSAWPGVLRTPPSLLKEPFWQCLWNFLNMWSRRLLKWQEGWLTVWRAWSMGTQPSESSSWSRADGWVFDKRHTLLGACAVLVFNKWDS